MSRAKEILKLIRVNQWTKNLLIFVPGFFAGKISEENILILTLGFIAFSLSASIVYIFNDIQDLEADRNDEVKKYRPLAKGTISIKSSLWSLLILLLLAATTLFKLNIDFTKILGSYLALNVFYSIGLKHIPILDALIISFGFLLRIFGGSVILDVAPSKWLILLTFFVALIITLAKRRNELLHKSPEKIRPALRGYNLKFTELTIVLLSGISIVFYVMYTIDSEVTYRLHSEYVYITVIFVLMGFLRYLQQVFVFNNAGTPSDLLIKDHLLKLIIILWIGSFYYFLYLN